MPSETDLIQAVKSNNASAVQETLALKISPNTIDKETGFSILQIAVREGYEAIVDLLLSHSKIKVNEVTNVTGATAFYLACRAGHTSIVRRFLRHRDTDLNIPRAVTI